MATIYFKDRTHEYVDNDKYEALQSALTAFVERKEDTVIKLSNKTVKASEIRSLELSRGNADASASHYDSGKMRMELKKYLTKENDDVFNRLKARVLEDIESNRPLFWTPSTKIAILEARKSEKDAEKSAQKISVKAFVGTLSLEGERKFLVDQLVIKSDGKDISILDPIGFGELKKIIEEVKNGQSAASYGQQQDAIRQMRMGVGVVSEALKLKE